MKTDCVEINRRTEGEVEFFWAKLAIFLVRNFSCSGLEF